MYYVVGVAQAKSIQESMEEFAPLQDDHDELLLNHGLINIVGL